MGLYGRFSPTSDLCGDVWQCGCASKLYKLILSALVGSALLSRFGPWPRLCTGGGVPLFGLAVLPYSRPTSGTGRLTASVRKFWSFVLFSSLTSLVYRFSPKTVTKLYYRAKARRPLRRGITALLSSIRLGASLRQRPIQSAGIAAVWRLAQALSFLLPCVGIIRPPLTFYVCPPQCFLRLALAHLTLVLLMILSLALRIIVL